MDDFDRVGLVRIHPTDNGEYRDQPPGPLADPSIQGSGYGDPWTWACAIGTKGTTATIFIAEHAPTNKERAAIRALFYEAGIKRVNWERKKESPVIKEFVIKNE